MVFCDSDRGAEMCGALVASRRKPDEALTLGAGQWGVCDEWRPRGQLHV